MAGRAPDRDGGAWHHLADGDPRAELCALWGLVTEAFRDRTVEISFLGYTGETLYNELYHRLEELHEDPGPTRHVVVRFLVPDFRVPMTVPSRVGEGATFTLLLIGTVLLVGALNFLPALTLGPVVEHFLMHAGKLY